MIVESICGFLKIEKPTYLDIGAADPIVSNNTYLFYQQGCRGVLVEPNPAFCLKLRSARPRDTVLDVGIGTTDQAEADYYVISGHLGEWLNTFSKEEAERVTSSPGSTNRIEKVLKMHLVNINKVIGEHFQRAPTLSASTPKDSISTSSSRSTSSASGPRSSASRRSSSTPPRRTRESSS